MCEKLYLKDDIKFVYFEEAQLDLFKYKKEVSCVSFKSLLKNNIRFNKIDSNTILSNGKCEEFLPYLKDNFVDLIITDPPYNLGKFMKNRKTNINKMRNNHFANSGWDDLSSEDWIKEMDNFLSESRRIIKKKGSLIIFMSLIKVETVIKLAESHGFYYKTTGIWHKTNPMPRNMNLQFVNSTEAWIYFVNEGTTGLFNNKGKLFHDFIETSLTSRKEKKFGKHPTQKPISLISHFVNLLSNEGDVVLDPFMGSGSTGVSCKRNNRKFIGIELNKEYYNLAENRIQEK